jgi:hypothetical protein
MNYQIPLDSFTSYHCSIMHDRSSAATLTFGTEPGWIIMETPGGAIGDCTLTPELYITADITNHQEYVLVLIAGFWSVDNSTDIPDLHIRFGILPKICTRIAFPVELLNSQVMFPRRTPVRLKMAVKGNRIHLPDLLRWGIGKEESVTGQRVDIEHFRIVSSEPSYPVPSCKFVDSLGQWGSRTWPGKTATVEALKTRLHDEVRTPPRRQYAHRSVYGGWTEHRFEKSGFFRIEHDGRRWWLVDPHGCAFYSTGIDCIAPWGACRVGGFEPLFSWLPRRTGRFRDNYRMRREWRYGNKRVLHFDFLTANLRRAFGNEWYPQWQRLTKNRLAAWGFNTVANWSDPRFIEYARMPYVKILGRFPKTERQIFRGFPDVFSDEYTRASRDYVSQLAAVRNDPLMIGYFLGNEPKWGFVDNLIVAELLLEQPGHFVTKEACIRFLSERYGGDIRSFNTAWGTDFYTFDRLQKPLIKAASFSDTARKDLRDFSARMIERFIEIPSTEARKADPNHLNLGLRYAYVGRNDLLFSGCRHLDVFSINGYRTDMRPDIRLAGEKTGLPVIIGEFHFGALDRGLPATGIKGVTDQSERGTAFRYYLETAASEPWSVGAHWFMLNDQSILGRTDGENYQIGFVDVCNRPYNEFIKGVQHAHRNLYDVAAGKTTPCSTPPKEIPCIF